MKRILGIFLIFSQLGLAAGRVEIPKLNEFCKKQSKPILSYSQLFADQDAKGYSKSELYLDRFKGELKGLYLTEKGPVTLIGQMTTKKDFMLCAYDFHKGGDALEIFKGKYLADGIELSSAIGQKIRIKESPYYLPNRDYSIEHKQSKHAYQMLGLTSEDDPDTCNYDEAYFEALGGNAKVNASFNKFIAEIKERYAQFDTRSRDCQAKKTFPNVYNLVMGLMYAGPRLMSVKVDYVTMSKSDSNWNGETLNFDREKNIVLEKEDLLSAKGEKPLVDEMKARLLRIYGGYGRFNSLEAVQFSFTGQTLVASFAPVDVKGFYMNQFRIDLPIPLNFARKFLNPQFFPQQ